MYETISVEQLFEEELEALVAQHEKLIAENTKDSMLIAERILPVIEYFKARLGLLEESVDEMYGVPENHTLH